MTGLIVVPAKVLSGCWTNAIVAAAPAVMMNWFDCVLIVPFAAVSVKVPTIFPS